VISADYDIKEYNRSAVALDKGNQ